MRSEVAVNSTGVVGKKIQRDTRFHKVVADLFDLRFFDPHIHSADFQHFRHDFHIHHRTDAFFIALILGAEPALSIEDAFDTLDVFGRINRTGDGQRIAHGHYRQFAVAEFAAFFDHGVTGFGQAFLQKQHNLGFGLERHQIDHVAAVKGQQLLEHFPMHDVADFAFEGDLVAADHCFHFGYIIQVAGQVAQHFLHIADHSDAVKFGHIVAHHLQIGHPGLVADDAQFGVVGNNFHADQRRITHPAILDREGQINDIERSNHIVEILGLTAGKRRAAQHKHKQ